MKASLEIDLLLHLGEFFNANLLERGIYRIRVSMACGNQRVVPVGMFTAPSTLDSFVGEQTVSQSNRIIVPLVVKLVSDHFCV